MNYIGSKQKLSPWILSVIQETYPHDLSEAVFADIFAGTGQVARHLKPYVKEVIVNDLESYSYALNSHYIKNNSAIEFPSIPLIEKEGPIYKNFSPKSEMGRMYFTESNAKIIDGIREEIEKSKTSKIITEEQYAWAIASLIEAADKVANTASVYGAYLKQFKKTALQPLNFSAVPFTAVEGQVNSVYQEDANNLIKRIKGDILYLDPPYNARQYGANYHVLNRIVENKDFHSEKLTGLIEYNKSNYCKNKAAQIALRELIDDAQFEYIFISYNNEGLIEESEFQAILKEFGEYSLVKKEYKRFKADSQRPNQVPTTFEHLHILRKL